MTAPQAERPPVVSVESIKNAALIGTLVTEHFSGLMLTVVLHVHIYPDTETVRVKTAT